MTLSLMMTATMLVSCGSGYDGSESRKSGSYNNERTTAENYRYSNVTAGDTDGTANIGGGYNTEEYNHLTENGYKLVSDEPLSTFSTDVDTASYTNVRRMINDGWEVDPDAVIIRSKRVCSAIHSFPSGLISVVPFEPLRIMKNMMDVNAMPPMMPP